MEGEGGLNGYVLIRCSKQSDFGASGAVFGGPLVGYMHPLRPTKRIYVCQQLHW